MSQIIQEAQSPGNTPGDPKKEETAQNKQSVSTGQNNNGQINTFKQFGHMQTGGTQPQSSNLLEHIKEVEEEYGDDSVNITAQFKEVQEKYGLTGNSQHDANSTFYDYEDN